MSNDPTDLPTRPAKVSSIRKSEKTEILPAKGTETIPKLNAEQFTAVIENGAKVAVNVLELVTELVEISHIRAVSDATVNEIHARSEAWDRAMRAEVDRLMAERKTIRTRGEVAVAIIKGVLSEIPENDQASRQLALEKLEGWLAQAYPRESSSGPTPEK